MAASIVLFELNEVPFRILEHFAATRPESTIAKLLRVADTYETVAEDVGSLSPWRTWPSVHRGVEDARHLISDFGQPLTEVDAAYPPIWRLLAQAGVPVGVAGSLHSYPLPPDPSNYRFYVPDIFASGPECLPEFVTPFQDVCLSLARESARNVSTRFPLWGAAKVIARAHMLGITMGTVSKVAAQLVGERVSPWKATRRRSMQPILAFDVFLRLLQNERPAFSTFFSNHVAAAMHRYWAAAFPGDYENPSYSEDWIHNYRNEIDFAMTCADEMLARVVAFVDANPGFRLLVASSMGQHAVEGQPRELQVYVQHADQFFGRLGLGKEDWSARPAMFAQYNFCVLNGMADAFANKLASVAINDEPLVFRRGPDGFFSIDFGHENLPDCQVGFGELREPLDAWGLYNVEITDKSGCTAYHIPEGSLLVYGGAPASAPRQRPQISALDICPAILRGFGVSVPDYMKKSGLAFA